MRRRRPRAGRGVATPATPCDQGRAVGPAPAGGRSSAAAAVRALCPRASGIAIRGDAWTWWRRRRQVSAPQPAGRGLGPGLRRTAPRRRPHGGGRGGARRPVILVSHANWLNRGPGPREHSGASMSRTTTGRWCGFGTLPGRSLGRRSYPAKASSGRIGPRPEGIAAGLIAEESECYRIFVAEMQLSYKSRLNLRRKGLTRWKSTH